MYCGSCGTELRAGARFCRACGRPQAAAAGATFPPPPPPPPPLPPPPGAAVGEARPVAAAALAILGGAGLCFLVLYATVYQPLHLGFPVNFGDPIDGGDVLALLSGAAAIAIGVLFLTRPVNRSLFAVLLVAAGLPTLLLSVMWTFPDTFHVDTYSHHVYSGFVYFAEFGHAEIGSRYVQVLLLASCSLLVAGGLLAALATPRQAVAAVR